MFRLPFLTKHKHNPNKFFTICINSNNVKVLLFFYDDKSETPYKIIGSTILPLKEYSVRNGIIANTDDVADKISSAVDAILDEQEEEVVATIVGIGGDLALGTITTAKSSRHPQKPLTQKDLDALYKRILNAGFLEAQNQYLLITGNADTELETTTSAVVYTKLDGQPIAYDNLIGRGAENIEQAIFSSFTPSYHLDSIKEVIKKTGLDLIAAGSEMYSTLEAIKNTGAQKSDLILVNIDSDYTEITIVFGGGIITSRALSIGFNHFAEELSQEMGLTLHQAKKVIHSYSSGELTQSEADVVKKCIKDVLIIWLNGLELLFAEFTGVRTFPSTALIFGIGSTVPDVFQAISSTSWSKSVPFKDTLTISKINTSDFLFLADTGGKVTSTDWIKPISLCMMHKELTQ